MPGINDEDFDIPANERAYIAVEKNRHGGRKAHGLHRCIGTDPQVGDVLSDIFSNHTDGGERLMWERQQYFKANPRAYAAAKKALRDDVGRGNSR